MEEESAVGVAIKGAIIQSLVVMLAFTLSGCIVASNFYTARTLRPGKIDLGFGADDISLKSTDKSLVIDKPPFIPSVALAYGLPLRLAIGARYWPGILEGTLRDQINPMAFTLFDFGVNFSYAEYFGHYSYIRYGASLSKDISGFEPFVNYTFYHFGANAGTSLSDGIFNGQFTDFIDNNHVLGFGIAIPVQTAKLYPELDYQSFGSGGGIGLWSFGIGLRAPLN